MKLDIKTKTTQVTRPIENADSVHFELDFELISHTLEKKNNFEWYILHGNSSKIIEIKKKNSAKSPIV